MHISQGDVLLPLSTLKRTVCPAVPTVADVVRLRGTAVKLSGEGGQATNNLPTFFHYLFVLADLRLTCVFHVKQSTLLSNKSDSCQSLTINHF